MGTLVTWRRRWTHRRKHRSASRSLQANCRHLGSSSLSLSVISGLPLSMDDLMEPPSHLDGTTSTPCMSTATSFATASSYCGDIDEIFQFDSFAEPFKTEARVLPQITTTSDDIQPRIKSVFGNMDPFSSPVFGEVPPSACSTFTEDPTLDLTDEQQVATLDQPTDATWTPSSLFDEAATTTTVATDSKDMAFLLTESSDALVADSAGTDLSSQHDEDSKEKLNGEEPATVATDTWQHVNDDDDATAILSNGKSEVAADSNGAVSNNDDAMPEIHGENGTAATVAECPTSPGTENGYALTDVIDDLMVAEFPETTAPQADSEEVVLLSPTPPTGPPPPPPEPEVDKPEVMEGEVDGKPEDDAAVGHQGAHEPRVTFSGPLQFMGRNDIPRDDVTPPLSPVSSPVKLLDVLPATLKHAAAAEASLGRTVPVTSGSIDAVSQDDTQSPWSAADTVTAEDQQEVFTESSPVVAGNEDNDGEVKTDAAGPNAVELISTTTCDVPVLVTSAAESSIGFPDGSSTEEVISDGDGNLDHPVAGKRINFIQSRNSDSLTNFFEYPDTSIDDITERHEQPSSDNGVLKSEELATASVTVTRTLLDNTDEKNVSEESDLSHKEDRKSSEMPQVEEYVTTEYESGEKGDDLHSEKISEAGVPSSDSYEHGEQPIIDDGSRSTVLKSEEEIVTCVTVTSETDRHSLSEGSDTKLENVGESEVPEELDVSHKDNSNLSDLPEVSQNKIKQEEEEDMEASSNEIQHRDETCATEVPSTETSANLPNFEPTEISPVQNVSDQVTTTSIQLLEEVKPHLNEDAEGRTTVEPFDPETSLQVETQDSETATPAVQTAPTTSPDAVEKMDNDIPLVSSDGLDAIISEEKKASTNFDLIVVDQPDIESHTENESPNIAFPSSFEQQPSIEEDYVLFDKSEPAIDTTGTPHVESKDDQVVAISIQSEEAVKPLGEEVTEGPVPVEASDEEVPAAGDDDVAGKMLSYTSQSVLAARDVFIEQQAAAAAVMENVCIQCEKRVYEMEKVVADQAVYHKTCFRCSHCNRVLSVANFACMEGHIYCKPHFMEIFMTKGTYDDSFAVAKEVDIAPYDIGDYGDRRPVSDADIEAVTMVPLETVRGVYEKLSREAVEAQLTRPLSARHTQQQQSNVDVDKNGYHHDAEDLQMGSMLVTSSTDGVTAGKKSMIQRTAAWTHDHQQNGRAISAPTTPVHRPLPVTDHDVIENEMPQRGLTQALVAQWREMEERAKAELRAGTSRSRSLSGLALRRGQSPSPSRRDEQGRSDDGAEMLELSDVDDHNLITAGEEGRSGLARQHHHKTPEIGERRELEHADEESQLPPPLMTQYMLAKFRDMEAVTQTTAALQAKDKKSFKWEVKQVTPLVRGLTGAGYGDVPHAPRTVRHDAPAKIGDAEAIGSLAEVGEGTSEQPMTSSMTADTMTSAGEIELPEPGTTRNLLAKFQSFHSTQ